MSKILKTLALFQAKVLVNTYTAITLPFYTVYQKPWQRLKLANAIRAQSLKKPDRIIWTRKGPPGKMPSLKCQTYIEAFKNLDRSRQSIGIRDVIEEKIELDEEGLPTIIDGRVVKRAVLANNYRWLTYGEVLDQVDNIAKGLYDLGVRKGNKVIIYAEANANWFFSSMAIAKLGAAVVTLFSNLGEAGVIYGMNQTKANFVITSEELKDKLLTYHDKLPHVKEIVYFPKPPQLSPNIWNETQKKDGKILPPVTIRIRSFDEVVKKGSEMPDMEFDLPTPDDLALIMYTSGTTSLPKAVLINHRMLMANVKSMTVCTEDNGFRYEDMLLASFLPLSHIFGFVFNIFMFINGSRIGFASPFTILSNSPGLVPGQTGDLKLLQPTIFVVVPLVLERIQKEIYGQLNKRGALAGPLFKYLMEYKARWILRGYQTPIIDKLICSKIKEQFGSDLQFVGVGGAALHSSIQEFAQAALNVNLINAYGCTETCGGVYMCNVDDLCFGVCGTPMEGVKAQLVDWPEGGYLTSDKPNQRGELVIGGEMVAGGYYKMPDESKEAFYTDEAGTRWFFTGDIGEMDPVYGRLRIIDRKKDLAKLANGEYVSLGKIETTLRSSRFVENICICTDLFSNDLIALISPNRKVLKELAKSLNKGHLSHKERCEDPEIKTIVHASIKETGKKEGLKGKEVPVLIKLTPEEWTPNNNLLTAAFKLKRKNVYSYYEKDVKQMFNSLLKKS